MRRKTSLTAALLLWLVPLAVAQELAPSAKTGLSVGEQAPAFKLKDQNGEQREFDGLRGNADFVAMVFYRSASC